MQKENDEDDLKDILTPSDKYSKSIYGDIEYKDEPSKISSKKIDEIQHTEIPTWVDPIIKIVGIIAVVLLLIKFGINISTR